MKLFVLLLSATLAISAGSEAFSQDSWPSKPIHIVVPYAPGGSTDSNIRVISAKASEILGQPIVVENKPGGATIIATQAVVKAEPDGYTLGAAAAPLTLNPALGIDTPYNGIDDLNHIIKLVDTPLCVLVHPDHPAHNFKQFVDWAKSQDKPILYATAAVGSMPHLWMEYAAKQLGIEVEHVGYRGSAPALVDVIAGNISVMVDGYTPGCARSKTGEVRALAVAWNKRLPILPDVPTLHELGFDLADGAAYTGIVAPKGTPVDIVDHINAAFNQALTDPDVRKTLEDSGILPAGGSPEEYNSFLNSEIVRWTKVVTENGIKPQG